MAADHIPIIVLGAVLLLIAFRQALGLARLRIWQIMFAGALVILLSGTVTPGQALRAVDMDVMVFLLGVFVIASALERSGLLYHLSFILFSRARTMDALVLTMLFACGLLSAFLMNDAVAVVGAPLVVHLATRLRTRPEPLLLALCFAVTIGSATSPIGNPQNLLIAFHVDRPFETFFRYLFVPTILNLIIAYAILRLFYAKDFKRIEAPAEKDELRDVPLAWAAMLSAALLVMLVALKVIGGRMYEPLDLRLTHIAAIAALPSAVIGIGGTGRSSFIRQIDWPTLVFFAAMFVVMDGVWTSGIVQGLASNGYGSAAHLSVESVMAVGVIASQVFSNVPLVALYLPFLVDPIVDERLLMALAASSTIAGNLFIMGAASNVIVAQGAQKRGHELGFWTFAKVGAPLTALNALVYWLFLGPIG